MKQIFTIFMTLMMLFNIAIRNVLAEDDKQSISSLPFKGYFIATENHAIEGLLFEGNQLYIYLSDQQQLEEDSLGHDKVQFLTNLHSFPHPDLKNYNANVRDLYLEEFELAYDLQDIYVEIAQMITAEMSQLDIQNLINNRIPGIYYTEKNDFQYFVIASPTVSNEEKWWSINLFGQDIYKLQLQADTAILVDSEGISYHYSAGIQPN